jgi:pimeloyl-ACP methyl ester carboxylesterase
MTSSVHIETSGGGPRTFVALHGWGGSHRTFHPLLPFLPADVTLHAIDCPGYGRSATPQWTREAYREAIAAAIDTIDAESFVLVGNCSGAIFGLDAVMQRHSARIERLVLYDPFAYTPVVLPTLS